MQRCYRCLAALFAAAPTGRSCRRYHRDGTKQHTPLAGGIITAAKKKAQAVANSSEMSEAMKLKTISKALRSNDSSNNRKQYVVAKKGQGNKGVRGGVMVDKRLKNDKRGMERAAKKRKSGKKGGLTGSKRRRHHK